MLTFGTQSIFLIKIIFKNITVIYSNNFPICIHYNQEKNHELSVGAQTDQEYK